MAAYVSVPRDLTRVKSKVLFNLTKRQVICFGSAALIGVPSFFLLRKLGNISLATLGMMVIMIPLFLLGMYERDGQPLEVIAYQFIQAKFIRPKIRPYRTDCYYAAIMRQCKVYEEVDAIVCNENESRIKACGEKSSRKSEHKNKAKSKCGRRRRN
ncbi:MAG: PrgI family protein [Clostridiales bacterium]|nr:PrgI family protein [Clostridiales bacterium]MCC8105961.1 PrgI family protein [Clostridiales bacterium]